AHRQPDHRPHRESIRQSGVREHQWHRRGVSYALDTKLRRLGDFGTFVIGAQGTFLNQYLIDSPRALREYYRDGDNTTPKLRANDTRDYSRVHAEYDAAGYRNLENFAPPLPKMRLSVPLSWI